MKILLLRLNLAFILFIGLYRLLGGFDNDEVITILPLFLFHIAYFFVLSKYINPFAPLRRQIWGYMLSLWVIISLKALFNPLNIDETLLICIFIEISFGIYFLSQSNLFLTKPTEENNQNRINMLQKILSLIDEANISEAFAAIDSTAIKSPTLSQLKKEFISGKTGFDFYDRLKMAVKNELKNTDKNEYNDTKSSFKDQRKIDIQKNLERLYQLLQEYEEKKDLETDPRELMKCEKEISRIKSDIQRYELNL